MALNLSFPGLCEECHGWRKLLYVNKWFEASLAEWGLLTQELLDEVSNDGSVAHNINIPDELKDIFQTAHDISPEWHIRMQAAFQKFTDNAVSKTINFPNHASVEDIRQAYELAYQLGCRALQFTVMEAGRTRSFQWETGSPLIFRSLQIRRLLPGKDRGHTRHNQRLETGCGTCM